MVDSHIGVLTDTSNNLLQGAFKKTSVNNNVGECVYDSKCKSCGFSTKQSDKFFEVKLDVSDVRLLPHTIKT